jgi:hypothetical protein
MYTHHSAAAAAATAVTAIVAAVMATNSSSSGRCSSGSCSRTSTHCFECSAALQCTLLIILCTSYASGNRCG